jgi:hypothetical protein
MGSNVCVRTLAVWLRDTLHPVTLERARDLLRVGKQEQNDQDCQGQEKENRFDGKINLIVF